MFRLAVAGVLCSSGAVSQEIDEDDIPFGLSFILCPPSHTWVFGAVAADTGGEV